MPESHLAASSAISSELIVVIFATPINRRGWGNEPVSLFHFKTNKHNPIYKLNRILQERLTHYKFENNPKQSIKLKT